ncbi:MAG TPA: hypothetical protein PKC72_10325 [Chitinophagaceae bacterium]|nr:hypothetical protein [Chitinophagaceae bacterium]
MKIVYLILLVVIVGIFLFLRQCVDRKVENLEDKEVVREGEELLGTWGTKTAASYLQFRLKRNGSLDYMLVKFPEKDTTQIKGTYTIADGANTSYFPRLVLLNEKSDTIFNYYIRSVTSYGSTARYDNLVISPNSIYDTIEYKFYRIKQ